MNQALTAPSLILQALQRLQEAGADRMDPVEWQFMQGLARRMAASTEAVRARLDLRLQQALEIYQTRWQAAPVGVTAPSPALCSPSPLAQLLRDHPGPAPVAEVPNLERRQIERAPQLAQFRQSLSLLGVQREVRQAMDQAPTNAGPINSHMLALRALQRMHSLSPAYLHRFITQVDSLMCLEAMEKAVPPAKKASAKNRRQAKP